MKFGYEVTVYIGTDTTDTFRNVETVTTPQGLTFEVVDNFFTYFFPTLEEAVEFIDQSVKLKKFGKRSHFQIYKAYFGTVEECLL